MYKLIFAPEFVKDLENTFDYISAILKVPNAAKKFMYPLCSEPLDALGYRKIVIENYILIYSVDEKSETVNLLRSFYGKRKYINFFS